MARRPFRFWPYAMRAVVWALMAIGAYCYDGVSGRPAIGGILSPLKYRAGAQISDLSRW